MDARLLTRMIEGHAAAAAASRRAASPALSAEESFLAAMELWELNPGLLDLPPDRLREQEVRRVAAAWARLRDRPRA